MQFARDPPNAIDRPICKASVVEPFSYISAGINAPAWNTSCVDPSSYVPAGVDAPAWNASGASGVDTLASCTYGVDTSLHASGRACCASSNDHPACASPLVPINSQTLPAAPPLSLSRTGLTTPRVLPLTPPASTTPLAASTPRTIPPAPTTPHATPPAPPASVPRATPPVSMTPHATPPVPPASTDSTPHTTPPALTIPHATPPAPTPVLSATAFPQSRPLCNAPLPPPVNRPTNPPPRRGASRGGGRGGSRGRGRGGGRSLTAREVGYTFLQTYDDAGNPVPLSLDTPLPGPTREEVREIRDREKTLDAAAEAMRAEEAWRKSLLHNPAGGADLIVLPLSQSRRKDGEDRSLELPEGTKRTRRPAASREMPVPLSARPVPGAADARQAQADADLLRRLQGGKQGKESKKRTRKDDTENAAPVAKKRR
ncbi:hypothetical protein MSAN_01122800 [Mycena sanguinolenta]|uniref:Uncharacterized protein n=1 Tax=Mycena sanguinolenta TaxID=230812 RepID=A0A8H7D6S4_9AGAR|nr:hypothetical protein MSAN_01122800 [Mycena sanguinolenta]